MVSLEKKDAYWMRKALKLAQKAFELNEVPVGALIVDENGRCLAQAYNKKEIIKSPLGHAELIALHNASQRTKSWRLSGCTLYVTLEPCSMCAGAIVHARLKRVVYGATDPKTGALKSVYQIGLDGKLNHAIEVTEGILANDSSDLLRAFFQKRRKENRQKKTLK